MSFWKKLWHGITGLGEWLEYMFADDLKRFIFDNRKLAIDVVIQVARDFAQHPSEVRWSAALKLLTKELSKQIPNIRFTDNAWIETLLQIAYMAAKSQGMLPK